MYVYQIIITCYKVCCLCFSNTYHRPLFGKLTLCSIHSTSRNVPLFYIERTHYKSTLASGQLKRQKQGQLQSPRSGNVTGKGWRQREGVFKNFSPLSGQLTVASVPPCLTFTWHVMLRLLYRFTVQLHSRLTFLAFTVDAVTPSGANM